MPTCCVRHLLQDLLRGQAQLHAGLWGWWRDGCRREAAAFTAGYDKSACQKLIVYYRLHWLHCINTYMSWMWTFGFTGNKSLREGACGLAEKLPIWLGKHRMTQQQSEGRCTHVEYITVKPKERMQVRTEHWKKRVEDLEQACSDGEESSGVWESTGNVFVEPDVVWLQRQKKDNGSWWWWY